MKNIIIGLIAMPFILIFGFPVFVIFTVFNLLYEVGYLVTKSVRELCQKRQETITH